VPVIRVVRPEDLTAEWLTAAIGVGTVERFSTARIGTGQMSECYRVALTYAGGAAGPASVVLKVAATDPASRQTGLALGLYEREVRFYTDIAPGIDGPVAPCYSSAFDSETGVFHLLLGDADPAVVGDEIRGATVEQATLAMTELGRLHAPLLGRTSMADVEWLNRDSPMNQALITQLYAGFVDRYGDDIAPAHREVCERLVAGFDAYLAQEAAANRVRGLVHGDYRLDNMLFGQQGADRPVTVVDWQTVTWGPATTDVAYFLGCALADDVRRDNYDGLLVAYHDALGPDAALTLDDVREGVRRQAFFGVMMAIVSSMLVERTERGDEMFMTMLRRHSQHVIDTDALATLPEPVVPDALQPSAADEGVHQPGAEPLWSESWYADFVDVAQGVGGWFRLGVIPNENRAWVNALLCGPGIPTIAVNDFEAALPDDAGVVSTDAVELTHTATEPLQTYHVRVRGRGEAYDDPSALLRGEGGRAVELSMDLTWTTAGTPYQYRLTPRYEIPCTVSGTVVADGRTFALTGVPGQRDHSWGVRDWWGMDWVWSALHLQDGTHLHGVDIRIPGAPPMGVGYIQPGDGSLIELQTVTAREAFGDNDLPVATELTLKPGDVTATVEIKGHAPVLLTATDGRVSRFPRAWATVTTADGRTGIGWLEWNRSQR
jgi:Ecdysteroid kinase-like family